MSSSIFNDQNNPSLFNQLINNLIQSNPAFADFYRHNKEKSPSQIAREYGVDLKQVENLVGRKLE